MKTEEDEAFYDLAKRQGSWGGGYQAKRKMAAHKLEGDVDAFERWWYYEGSAPPYTHHDCEEHTKRMCQIAWSNGAYVAAQPAQEPEREALKLALEALERSVATCFDQYAHQQVMSQPDHFMNQAITAIKEALAQPPQRTWIWLSDADIADVVDTTCQYTGIYEEYLIKKAERKIRSMNT